MATAASAATPKKKGNQKSFIDTLESFTGTLKFIGVVVWALIVLIVITFVSLKVSPWFTLIVWGAIGGFFYWVSQDQKREMAQFMDATKWGPVTGTWFRGRNKAFRWELGFLIQVLPPYAIVGFRPTVTSKDTGDFLDLDPDESLALLDGYFVWKPGWHLFIPRIRHEIIRVMSYRPLQVNLKDLKVHCGRMIFTINSRVTVSIINVAATAVRLGEDQLNTTESGYPSERVHAMLEAIFSKMSPGQAAALAADDIGKLTRGLVVQPLSRHNALVEMHKYRRKEDGYDTLDELKERPELSEIMGLEEKDYYFFYSLVERLIFVQPRDRNGTPIEGGEIAYVNEYVSCHYGIRFDDFQVQTVTPPNEISEATEAEFSATLLLRASHNIGDALGQLKERTGAPAWAVILGEAYAEAHGGRSLLGGRAVERNQEGGGSRSS